MSGESSALVNIGPDGKPVTTSLLVADRFAKRHGNVLMALRKLECSEEFNALNFKLVEYRDSKGETRPMYEITRDGFMFLAMGFTGKEAAEWKEKFIEAFNRVETHAMTMVEAVQTASAALDKSVRAIGRITSGQIEIRQEVNGLRDDVTDLRADIRAIPLRRQPWSRNVTSDCINTLHRFFNGRDPISGERLLDNAGRPLSGIQIDHWNGRPWDSVRTNAFPCSSTTNERLKDPIYRHENESSFQQFQRKLKAIPRPRRIAHPLRGKSTRCQMTPMLPGMR